jgi:hypothetical protein
MEPIGLAASLSTLLGLCTNISRALYTYTKGTDVVGEAIQSLQNEIHLLSNFIKSCQSFKDSSFHDVPSLKSQVIEKYASDVQQSINDCKKFLQHLDIEMTEFIQPRGCLFFSHVEADIKLKKIDLFSRQLAVHCQNLNLHIQQIILYFH